MSNLGRRICVCSHCGRIRFHVAKGMCGVCYRNSRRVYRPTGNPGGRGVAKGAVKVAARIADYAEIRARGYTIAAAAQRLGVSDRTAARYQARLSRRGQP